ncbi:MAG: hypothetical protein DPW16_12700 [Chloroflexi bacterium]|nr:hypothetical protein [Chloroflexota bacterium]
MTDTETLSLLNEQLLSAAQAFAEDASGVSDLLTRLVQDVERAMREPLDIFPVCHHSPASALHMVRRLQTQPPKVIYMELCEDMLPLIENLRDCKLPVALQAFAAESSTLPPDALPVMAVAPLTEASAEYQAIAYCLTHPETELVFVDRAVDYIFQWDEDWKRDLEQLEAEDETVERENAGLHGTAVGITVGELIPTFDEFLHFLLRNSNTRYFAEWWDQYVERTIINADYATYKQVMVLVGSLLRHLGRRAEDVRVDLLRERYMWTRIKQHMHQHDVQPHEAMYICGAAHVGSEVEEFGTFSTLIWELPPHTDTRWLYGLIPSSFAAIERQFSHPAGTVSLAEGTWDKSLKAEKIKPFDLKKPDASPRKPTLREMTRNPHVLAEFLTQPPAYAAADKEQLLQWCVQIVALARKNGYLASTADSIAIYETAILLAQMRNRQHPTPYDFQDAAITCLEKDRTPKKRTIAHLCQILLGGDRVGTVGYASLPPLAQDIYDRLAPLEVDLFAKTNQRALMDFKTRPDRRACSEILWKLHYLFGNLVVRPIVGERKLGHVPIQESWDVLIGKHQREIIQLGYEGVTLEQVLEQRMKALAFAENATAAIALKTAEDALLYKISQRLVRELGLHAITLLKQETSATDAPDIFQRARRLVHYYRTQPGGLPDWLESLITTGYAHYAAMLPQAFADMGTRPEQIAGMLGFIFTLESLALALGCQRNQLMLGLQGAAQNEIPPDKLGLLWTSEWLLGLRDIASMREFLTQILSDALRLPTLPQYLNGFVLALNFAPGIARFVVELLSHIFGSVTDSTLLMWLPGLILQLRQHQTILQPLIKEASVVFPASLQGFMNWQPPWAETHTPVPSLQTSISPQLAKVRDHLLAAPAATHAVATWLGLDVATSLHSLPDKTINGLLQAYPESTNALAAFIDS